MTDIFGTIASDRRNGTVAADMILAGPKDGDPRLEVGSDTLWGGDGHDTIFGLGGDDLLSGGADNDVLSGGGGKDRLYGGLGADTMDGGAGDDVYVIDSSLDRIIEAAGGGSDTILSSITRVLGAEQENLVLTGQDAADAYGNALDNRITGNAAGNSLVGGAGYDTLSGGAGDDVYVTHFGEDLFLEARGGGTDQVVTSWSFTLPFAVEDIVLTGDGDHGLGGNGLDNRMRGNLGDNLIFAHGGDDTVGAGWGNDTVWGQEGADLLVAGGDQYVDYFRYKKPEESPVAASDTIEHFEAMDRIDLFLMDANSGRHGNQAFHLIGSDAFSGSGGELRYTGTNTRSTISGDVDGDKLPDFAILVLGAVGLLDDNLLL